MSEKKEQILVSALLAIITCATVEAKSNWGDSPLPKEARTALDRAGSSMKSGKHAKAKPAILAVLARVNDVPKCLAIAQFTEPYAFPMLDVRRQCVDKALSLCQNSDDYILVALKSRKYQFYEVTRQAISELIKQAKTLPELYDLSRKAQEVSLNDLSHLAMEKAYSGLHTEEEAFVFADHCKGVGLDDLLRKALKQIIDDENESGALCDLALKIEKYNMRDLNRYLLRKALDNCKTVPDMEAIQEVARRLNEPDVMERAHYYVKKGKVLQKIKADQAEHQNRLKSWREANDQNQAREETQKASERDGFGSSNPQNTPAEAPNASSGY